MLFPGYSKKIYIHPPHQQDDHSCCSGCPECIPCLWKVAHQSSQKYTFKAILERRHTLSGTSPPDRLHAKGKPVVFFYPLGEGGRLCRQLAKPWRLQEEPRTPKPAPHGKPPRAQAGAAAGTAAREPAGQSAHRGRGGARLSSRRNGMDLREAEDIKKRWQEYTEELYKKDLYNPDNHDGVITHRHSGM